MRVRCPDVDDGVEGPLDRGGVPNLESRWQARGAFTGLGDRVGVEVDAQPLRSGMPAYYAQQNLAAATTAIEHERV